MAAQSLSDEEADHPEGPDRNRILGTQEITPTLKQAGSLPSGRCPPGSVIFFGESVPKDDGSMLSHAH